MLEFPPARNDKSPTIVSFALIVVANLIAVLGWHLPLIGPALGFWFILVHPAYLCYTSSVFGRSSVAERAGYSVASVVLFLMLAGLAANTVLPIIGIQRPLDAVPVVIIADVLNLLAFRLRLRFPARLNWRAGFSSVRQRECRLLVGSALCVPLAVLGAIRINNGAGDQLSIAALVIMTATVILLLLWQRWSRDGVISAVVYLLSLALLLMTSLRGWSVTGHDIQDEYLVFQYTEAHGHWSMASFPHNTYNACLSITILPTEFARVLDIYSPDVYKFFFQSLFALCPVLVYAISRRHWSRHVSILAAIYFIGFPTFFTDLTYDNRQEVAFLFVSVAILAMTNYWWSRSQRQIAIITAAVGIELAHYSTMYIFLGILVIGLVATRIGRRLRLTHPRRGGQVRRGVPGFTISWSSVAAAAAILVAWGGLATQTAGSALSAIESAIPGTSGRSTAVLYGVFHASLPPPQVLLAQYRQQTLRVNAESGDFFIPASLAAQYPTPYISEPSMPLTAIGRSLERLGLPVASINNDVRQGAAKDEQLFIGIGMVAILATARLRRLLGPEFIGLVIGSVVMLGLITVLPGLSVQYGVLRAFQEALIVIAPVLVEGSITIFSLFGGALKARAAAVVCVGIFFSTCGLMPQLLGDYQAQLSLNNSGQYYDDFYTHPQEVAAVGWLAGKPGVLPDGLQATMNPDRFKFTSPSDVVANQFIVGAFPTLIQRKGWVLLDYSTIHTHRATVNIQSDLINYVYPMAFIDKEKNLVYNNGGAEIFK